MKLPSSASRWLIIPTMLIATVLFAAESCEGESDPGVDSDSSQSYEDGAKSPTDTEVYLITGTVAAEVGSLTRQTKPGGGKIDSPTCFGTSGCYGGGGGSFFGPVEQGKGFVRLIVSDVSPSTDLAQIGSLSILKVADTKATALLPGDTVTFKCRRQYEAVAAVKDNQKFNADEVASWELDYCRMATAVITPGEAVIE